MKRHTLAAVGIKIAKPLKPKRSRAERRLETTKKVDQLKSEILGVALDALTEMERKKPMPEPRELLEHALQAAHDEAAAIFRDIEPQNKHLAVRAAIEVKLDLHDAMRKRLAARMAT